MVQSKDLIRFGDLDLIFKITAVEKLKIHWGRREGYLFSLKTLLLVCPFFFYSGTTAPRILKFGTNIGVTSCIVKERISILMLIILCICPFLFLPYKNQLQISLFLLEPVFKFGMGVVGCGKGVMYLASPGCPTDIGLQLGKACYPCSR